MVQRLFDRSFAERADTGRLRTQLRDGQQ
jgi:hypothetical protein